MADPNFIKCVGTTITFNSQAVGGVFGLTGFMSGKAEEKDVSTWASTAKEFMFGLPDNGEFTVKFSRRNLDDVGQAAMLTARDAGTAHTMVITLPSSTANVLTFSAYCTAITLELEDDGAATGEATIRITGAVVAT